MGGRGEEGGGTMGRGKKEEVMEDERRLADWKPVRVSVIIHPIAIIIKSSVCALSLL